jgi:transposase InsO family protein
MSGRSIICLIAFIDDASRFITGWETVSDKKGETTARVLRRILESDPSPCVLGSDNGREFRGDMFRNVLAQFGIRTWYSQHYTLQHSGKIERF